MSITTREPEIPRLQPSIHSSRTLPPWTPWALLAGCLVVAGLLLDFKIGRTAILGALLYLASIYILSRVVENPRRATDRMMTGLVTSAFVLAVAPLVSLVWTVIKNGVPALSAEFFSSSMRNVVG